MVGRKIIRGRNLKIALVTHLKVHKKSGNEKIEDRAAMNAWNPVFMALLILSFLLIAPTVNATVEPGVTTNPCIRGFVDFEEGTDDAVIHSTVPGVKFTTTAGLDWLYGDWRTGKYNGKYPNGAYTSNGNLWAWLGPNQGYGRIDFTEGTANYFSLLTSTQSGVTIDAYDSNGNLLTNSGRATGNSNTGLMTRLSVSAAGMAYVIVHDTGNYWLIDDICTDAGGVPISKKVSSTFGTPNSNSNIPFSFEPVNLASGNYIYQYQDLFIPGRGLPLTITRSYNSLDSYNGSFGYGWTFNYNINLAVGGNGNVVVMREDGRRDFYTLNPDGSYTSPLGVYDVLTKNPDGSYILNRKDQVKYSFTPQGKLNNIIDKNGNQIDFTYSGNSLTNVTDASGRKLNFTYDAAGRILAITDPISRVWSYTYDDKGNLVQYTNPLGGQFSYTYNDKHWMTSITDPRGKQIMANTYDWSGSVISQSNALGATYTFNYDFVNRTTTETNPFGKTKIYIYNDHFWELNETDALGNTTSYAYDINGNKISSTDANGHIIRFTYDANGNTIQIADPLSHTTSINYDSKNNPTSLTDALGRQMLLEYDAYSDLIKIINALGDATVFNYDGYGQIISGTDAKGNTTNFGYDIFGNQKTVTDALGNTVAFTYDEVGRLIEITDPDGNKYRLTYDDLNRLISVTDPLGHTASNTYDATGNRISFTDSAGNVTTYSYNSLNKLSIVTDALGGTVRYNYDAIGNKVSMTDANGHTTNYVYDPLNRPTSIIDPLGYTANNTYDAVGNRISFTDAAGKLTKYNFDPLNRLVKVTDAMGGSVYYTYDAVGNMMSMKDANSHTTNYVYDPLNRPVSIIDPLGNITSSTYDTVGNIVRSKDANGKTTLYSYDGLNRLTKIVYPDGKTVSFGYDARGNRLMMADSQGTTNYQYDELNRLLGVLNPSGQKVSYKYDAVGNRLQITYPDNKITSYSYDATDRLIGVTDRNGGITGYTYDPNGNLIGMTYPNSMKTAYVYDEDNRLTELINKNSTQIVSSFKYTMDAVGNRLKVDEKFSGRFEDATQTTNYEYDNLYRLIKVNYPFDKIVKYSYDPMGNRINMISTIDGNDSSVNYVYDAADRLLQSGKVIYSYDNNGNLIKKVENPGRVLAYGYDGANRLINISTLFGSERYLYNFEYDGDGNRISKTIIHGKSTQSSKYVLDVNNVLPQVLTESNNKNTTFYTYGTELISMTDPQRGEFYYHQDGLGSVRSMSDSKQSIKNIYLYDAFGQVQKEMGHVDNEFQFTGEQMDDETGLMYLRARYYDPAIGRFITRDPVAGFASSPLSLNRYTYAYNNPINLVDRNGRFAIWDDVLVTSVGAIGGFATQYSSDVMGNIAAGKTGWDMFKMTSNWKLYAVSAAGGAVTAEAAYLAAPLAATYLSASLAPLAAPLVMGLGSGATSLAQDWAIGGQYDMAGAIKSGLIGAVTYGLIDQFPNVRGAWPNFGTEAFWFGKHTQNLLIQEAIGVGINVIQGSLSAIYNTYSSISNYNGMSHNYNLMGGIK